MEPEAPEAEVPAPEVAEAPAMPPLPETPVAEASSTKERTPDGARVVTTCAGAVARAPPPVEPSEMPGAVALPGLALRRSRPFPSAARVLFYLPTRVPIAYASQVAAADVPPPAPPTKDAEPAEPAPPVPPTPAVAQPTTTTTTTARRNVVTSWGAATARRVPAAASPRPPSKTPAPANVVRGWGPAARAPAALPTPERNRAKAAAAAARRRSMAPTAPPEKKKAERKSSLTAPVAPKFAERKARPQRLSTEEQQLRAAAQKRAQLKARLAANARAVPGAAGTARRAARAAASPRRVVQQSKPAPAMRRGPTIAKPFTFGASRRQTVAFREPAPLLLSRNDWRRPTPPCRRGGARSRRPAPKDARRSRNRRRPR